MGSIIWFAASVPPKGYIECNGQSTSSYPKLAAIVGSKVPDLRGVFIRGWDHGRDIDNNRSFATYQKDTLQGHNHRLPINADMKNTEWGPWNYGDSLGGNELLNPARWTTGGQIVSDGINGIPRISFETRPKNVSLLPCIKHD